MPPRVLVALFGKGIAAAIPVQNFVLIRLAVAPLALAPMIRSKPGPSLRA
jgi:hypothetical protein